MSKDRKRPIYHFVKRAFDLCASAVLFILILPFWLLLDIVIYIDDPHGSPMFTQMRVGKNGKLFKLYKFRTMVVNAEDILHELKDKNEMDGPVFKIKDDPRITKIGKFLRKTSLDELPQLLNVIKGDMSLVGPRPALPNEVAEYTEEQKIRLSVTPGVTCYWQVQPKRNTLTFDQWVALDKKYIEEQSVLTDLKILFMTVGAVINKEGM